MAAAFTADEADTKDILEYQVFLIEAMEDTFLEYLDPSEIIHSVGLTGRQKEFIIEDNIGRAKSVNRLIKKVLGDPREHVSLFVAALRSVGFERFINILDDRPENKDMDRAAEKYDILIRLLEGDLIKKITPSDVIDDLVPILGAGDHEEILALEERRGPIPACRELFLRMKRKKTNWPLRFLEVLHKNLPHLPPKMDPAFANTEVISPQESDEDEDDDETALSDEEKQNHEIPEKDLPPRSNSGLAGLYDSMRLYQLELAEKAIDGENCIVYAPTGSGKTRVAIYIAKHVLENSNGVGRKVLFLEPTVALVDQTYKAVHRYLGKHYKVQKVRGRDTTSLSLHTVLPLNNILVMTPKILDNYLTGVGLGNVSENHRTLSGLCHLLILDECHHTRKEEVYNQLMLRYLKEKTDGAVELPQILGLTATLGVEKALTTEDAVTNILKLCANLDTAVIAKVDIHTEELAQLVAVPEEEVILLTEKQESPSKRIVEAAMAKVEENLAQFHALQEDEVNKLRARTEMDRKSQKYNQWTVFIKDAASKVVTHDDHRRIELTRNLHAVGEHLYNYNVALTIEDTVRIMDVVDYLKREVVSSGMRGDCTALETQLKEIAYDVVEALMVEERKRIQDRKHENPRLVQLADTLQDIVENNEGDSRVIIFATTRVMCGALAKWLNQDPHIPQALKDLRADVFTGLQAKGQAGGMTQAEQDAVIAKFRSGEIKLIFATSAGHEGLDIPECNIVISYNHVGNEITTMQTKGRSRKAGGKAVLLASSDVQQKQEENLVKVHLMKTAISKIREMQQLDIERDIARFQKETLDNAKMKEITRQVTDLKMEDVVFSLICKCRKVSVSGQTMRLINGAHRITVDKEVRDSKINIVLFSDPHRVDDVSFDGSISCRICKQPWGTWITYQKVKYPSLSIKNFSVQGDDVRDLQTFKKWKKCPYTIKPLTAEDTLQYLRLDKDNSSSEDELFDLC